MSGDTILPIVRGQLPARPRPLILKLYAQGHGPTAIARLFNARGVPTPSGRGTWRAEQVQRHADPEGWAAYMRRYRAARRAGL